MTQFKEEKSKKFAAKETLNLLAESEKAKKSVEAVVLGFEKQAQEQRSHLWKVEEQLAIAKENIEALKKELEATRPKLKRLSRQPMSLGRQKPW